jgi:hypothetical protein
MRTAHLRLKASRNRSAAIGHRAVYDLARTLAPF